MRKLLFIFILFVLAFIIYGCKPVLPNQLYGYIEYIEKIKLRGQNNDFFVELVIGVKDSKDFCEISLIPVNLYTDTDNIEFVYGQNKGVFQKDITTNKYIASFEYDKVHHFVTIRVGNKNKIVSLFPLTNPFPSEALMQKAYCFYEDRITDFVKFQEDICIQLKIIADMQGNAFYYIGFIGNNEYYAVLFDIDTEEIIAHYVR